MFYLSRKVKIFIAFFGIIIAGYFASNIIKSTGAVPADFKTARMQGALIAQSIVELSAESARDLQKINELDRQGDYTKALELTSEVFLQSQKIREEAVALSNQIEKMTVALPSIKSLEAQQAALEAITDRLALISRLINYSATLEQLLSVLRNRFVGIPGNYAVGGILEKINEEVKAINDFNTKAIAAMDRFDAIINK